MVGSELSPHFMEPNWFLGMLQGGNAPFVWDVL